jgi:hypothetical protein
MKWRIALVVFFFTAAAAFELAWYIEVQTMMRQAEATGGVVSLRPFNWLIHLAGCSAGIGLVFLGKLTVTGIAEFRRCRRRSSN